MAMLREPATHPLFDSSGDRAPALYIGRGQLLLAYQDEKWREQYLRRIKLVPLSSRTITDRDTLRRKLDAIAESGLSESVSEAVEGATGVAARSSARMAD